jgi:hypothetical protein
MYNFRNCTLFAEFSELANPLVLEGVSEEAAKSGPKPYNKIVEELPQTRRVAVHLMGRLSAKVAARKCWLITDARGTRR